MTKEKYLALCEQLNKLPQESKCPPDIGDFPVSVQQAIEIFNMLGDRIYPDVGYVGKDYTTLELHMKVYKVDPSDTFMETLARLDSHMIQRSADQLKKARDSIKKKGHGK